MKIRKHVLIDTNQGGNGYHGRCKHCRVALVTDLGFCSWDNLECIEREIEHFDDLPNNIKDYAKWHGLQWDNKRKVFVRPYSNEEYTIDQLDERLNSILI